MTGHKFIGFKLPAGFLDVPADLSITLEISSGIFALDVVEGNFSLPVNFDNTPTNQQLFGHANRIETEADTGTPYDCELWLYGRFAFRGHLKLLPYDGYQYTAYFICGAGSLKELLNTEKLREVFAEDEIELTQDSYTPAGIVILWENPTRWPTASFSIQDTFGNGFSFSGDSRRSGFYNMAAQISNHPSLFITATVVTIDSKIGLQLIYETGYTYTILSQGAPRGISTQALPSFIGELDFPTTADWQNKVAFPSIYFNDFFAGKNPTFQSNSIANHYINGKLQTENTIYRQQELNEETTRAYVLRRAPEVATAWENTLVPQVYNRYILQEIFSRAGIRLAGDFVEDEELNTLLVFNPHTLDKLEYDQDEGWYNRNVHDFTIKLPRHLPDVDIRTFLMAQKLTFCLAYIWNFQRTECRMLFIRDILESTDVDDWTQYAKPRPVTGMQEIWKGIRFSFNLDNADLLLRDQVQDIKPYGPVNPTYLDKNTDLTSITPELDEIRYIRSNNVLFRYIDYKNEQPAWKSLGYNLSPYDYQGEGIAIESPACPMPTAYRHTGRLMPYADYTAISLPLELTKDDFGIRFTFYRGLRNDIAGTAYAMANSNRFDNDLAVNANWKYDLQWDKSEHGIFDTFWKRYAQWRKTARPETQILTIPLGVLLQTNLAKKKRVENMNYIIDRMRLRIGPNGLEPVETQWYNVRFGQNE